MKIKNLKAIRNILRTKGAILPILDYFLIDAEYLTATNLETIIKVKHNFPIKPDSKPICIRAEHFIQRIERIKAPYFIAADENLKITFEQSESESKMLGLPPEEYPAGPVFKEPKELCTITDYEIRIMNIASQFTADDELRPVMQTVCLDPEHIVASDAHKLYYKKISKVSDNQILFSRQVIKLLLLSEGQSFKISSSGNYLFAESPGMTISWRNATDISSSYKNYPAWEKILPTPTFSAIIPVKETILAISAIMYAANQATGRIIIKIEKNSMKILCSDLDNDISASETVTIINSGNGDIEFGVKGRFVLALLKCLQNEGLSQVTMGWTDPSKAFVFHDYFLLMPMMINP